MNEKLAKDLLERYEPLYGEEYRKNVYMDLTSGINFGAAILPNNKIISVIWDHYKELYGKIFLKDAEYKLVIGYSPIRYFGYRIVEVDPEDQIIWLEKTDESFLL